MPLERALICLGSNILPWHNLPRAIERLDEVLPLVKVSSLYASPARGAPGSPPFLNAAVAADTDLDPYELKFDLLRPLEAELGRVRGPDPNAPRSIDLDLVLYGQRIVDDPERGLCLPDPEIVSSPHTVLPLAEIEGETRHPILGESLAEIAARCRDRGEIRVVAPPPRHGGRND